MPKEFENNHSEKNNRPTPELGSSEQVEGFLLNEPNEKVFRYTGQPKTMDGYYKKINQAQACRVIYDDDIKAWKNIFGVEEIFTIDDFNEDHQFEGVAINAGSIEEVEAVPNWELFSYKKRMVFEKISPNYAIPMMKKNDGWVPLKKVGDRWIPARKNDETSGQVALPINELNSIVAGL